MIEMEKDNIIHTRGIAEPTENTTGSFDLPMKLSTTTKKLAVFPDVCIVSVLNGGCLCFRLGDILLAF